MTGKIERIDRFARQAAVRLYLLLWLLVAISFGGWVWFGTAAGQAS